MERTKTPANAPRDGSDPLTSRYLNLKIARLVANDEPLAFLRLVAGTDVNLQRNVLCFPICEWLIMWRHWSWCRGRRHLKSVISGECVGLPIARSPFSVCRKTRKVLSSLHDAFILLRDMFNL